MANEVDFYITEGDTTDPLEVTLKSDDGTAIDLTGATVRFEMVPVGGDSLTFSATATIDDATAGEVTYEWADGDTDDAGYYNGRFVVDYSGDTGSNFDADQSFPNENYITVKVDEGLV